MLWQVLADTVLVVHAAFVAFVVLGFAAIVLGLAAGRAWARTFPLRVVHLVSMLFVAAEALAGRMCPLTTLESALRRRAGESAYPGDFIAYWLHQLIFYDWPPWVFMALYLGFAAAVLATFVLAPPRRVARKRARQPRAPCE